MPKQKTTKYSNEDQEIMVLARILLADLDKHKMPRVYQNIKALGCFLTAVGEALKEGSVAEARKIRLETFPGEQLVSPKVGVSLALMGDTIMDWSAGLRAFEKNMLFGKRYGIDGKQLKELTKAKK